MRDFRQDVAPHCGVVAPVVRQHDDAPIRYVIDVVAHGAGRFCCSAILNGECAASQAKARVQGLDAIALAHNAQPVERVTDGCGVE